MRTGRKRTENPKQGLTLDPIYIESLATADLNLDGRPDLVATLSTEDSFRKCEVHAWYNEADLSQAPWFTLVYAGRLDDAFETDPWYARMPTFADLDGGWR